MNIIYLKSFKINQIIKDKELFNFFLIYQNFKKQKIICILIY